MGYYEGFVTGFLTDPIGIILFGRLIGLFVLKDRSLIFTENGNNRTYQAQYKNNAHRFSFVSMTFLIICNYLFILLTL